MILKRLLFSSWIKKLLVLFVVYSLNANNYHIFFTQSKFHNNNDNPYGNIFELEYPDSFKISFSTNSVISNILPHNVFNLGFHNRYNDFSANVLAQASYGESGQYELGTTFDRNNYVARINNAIIGYNSSNFSIFFGRASPIWGLNKANSIILSGQYSGLDHFLMMFKSNRINLQIFHGQLNSEYDLNGTRIIRNIAGHKISWKPNDASLLNMGELVIYAGENRSLELIYLNPFVPYFFSALEGEQKSNYKDNTNSVMFFYGKSMIKDSYEVFFELIVDDYQIDDTSIPNSTGFKVGLQKDFMFTKIPFELVISNTQINPNVYLHRSSYTSWNHFGNSLGDIYGPDQSNTKIIFNTKSNFNYNFHFDFTSILKGKLFFEDKLNRFDGAETIVKSKNYLFGNLNFSLRQKSFLLRIGWHNKPFPIEISNGQKFHSLQSSGTYYFAINYLK